MRSVLLTSSLCAAAALSLCGCVGEAISGSLTDGGADGGAGGGLGSDAGACTDITGSDTLDLAVVSGPFGYPLTARDEGTPVDGAGLHIETADGTGCLEVTAGADGRASVKVDLAKGPLDITAAKAGLGAASVVGVTTAADVAGKALWLPQPLVATAYDVTGAITNLQAATDHVQLDGAWLETQWLVSGSAPTSSYATKQVYVPADPAPVRVAALDIDAQNNLVKGVWTPTQARAEGAMVADVDFSSGSTAVTKAYLQLFLPTTGQLTASMIGSSVGEFTGNAGVHPSWTNSTVARRVGQSAAIVGIAVLAPPTGNECYFLVQYLDGDLTPDYATAFLYQNGTGRSLTVHVKTADLTFGKQITVPPMPPMQVTHPTGFKDLSSLRLAFDATSADWVGASIHDASNNATIWALSFAGKTVTDKALPHLPSTVALRQLTGAAQVVLSVVSSKGASQASDFAPAVGDGVVADWSYRTLHQLPGAGR